MNPGLKNTAHRGLNLMLWLGFCLLAGSGYLLSYRLPHGRENRNLRFLDLSRHEWGEVHFWAGSVFVAAIFLHLFLNRAWLVKIGARSRRPVLWLVLAIGVLLLLGFACYPLKTI